MPDHLIDSLFNSYFKTNEPGGAILLVKDNKIIYEKGFGIADINTKVPITPKDEENFAPLKATEKLEFEPGSRCKYSNPAFNGLALIIENVTGKKWQDYISKKIFKPSGMKKSTITDGPHPHSGVAHAYVKNKNGGFDEFDYGEQPTFAAAGNGGVWSRPIGEIRSKLFGILRQQGILQ